MAKIPDGILSGFRGRIGNIVGVKRYGDYYIRSQPTKIKDRKSPKQLLQRDKLRIVSTLGSTLKEFIKITFGTLKPHRPIDPFRSNNMKSAINIDDNECSLKYEGLMVSSGPLFNVEDAKAERTSKNEVRVTWADNSDQALAEADDKVYVLGMYKVGRHHYPHFEEVPVLRKDEYAYLPIGPALEKFHFHLYICTVSSDGKMASNSTYLGIY